MESSAAFPNGQTMRGDGITSGEFRSIEGRRAEDKVLGAIQAVTDAIRIRDIMEYSDG
jgi:hypothetical protein